MKFGIYAHDPWLIIVETSPDAVAKQGVYHCLSVCLSVHLSHIEAQANFFTAGSHTILVFEYPMLPGHPWDLHKTSELPFAENT